jgi:hypothetical protein
MHLHSFSLALPFSSEVIWPIESFLLKSPNYILVAETMKPKLRGLAEMTLPPVTSPSTIPVLEANEDSTLRSLSDYYFISSVMLS